MHSTKDQIREKAFSGRVAEVIKHLTSPCPSANLEGAV